MSRRVQSACGRRGGGGGGGLRGGAQSAAAILGSNLLLEWDARTGNGANTWTDSVRAAVLTGVGTPTLATDGGNFKGLAVWTFVSASSQFMDTSGLASPVIASGQTLYGSIVFRMTNVGGAGAQRLTELLDSGASAEVTQVARSAGAAGPMSVYYGGVQGTLFAAPPSDTSVHLLEYWITASQVGLSLDATDATASGSFSTQATLQRVVLAAFPGAVLPADVKIARSRLCLSLPSTAQRQQLRALDQQIWGVP